MSDLIFDIKEFALHDGNGLRTTVFFKGCPLKCMWCHNPESQSYEKEIAKNKNKCTDCGLCKMGCSHSECEGLGICTKVCPNNCIKTVGEEYTPEELAEKLLKNKRFIEKGGVTFSGGEPFMHTEFIEQTVRLLKNIKTAAETCGYVQRDIFERACNCVDSIYMDIKLINDMQHIKYTGKSNKLILKNAEYLLKTGRKVTFRVPLIPTVTDTEENLNGIAEFLEMDRDNINVELLPYNKLTGAKYKSIGREYNPPFNENGVINKNTRPFEKRNIKVRTF